MADVPPKQNAPLAAILFRREALVFLITLACSLLIFLLMLRWLFHSNLYQQYPDRQEIVPIKSRCHRLSGYYPNQKSLNSR